MMRRWEIAGWVLLGVGLLIFYQVVSLLVREPPALLLSGPLSFIGFVVFRGGIHLLKVGAAAQACLDWQARQREKETPRPRVPEPRLDVLPKL